MPPIRRLSRSLSCKAQPAAALAQKQVAIVKDGITTHSRRSHREFLTVGRREEV